MIFIETPLFTKLVPAYFSDEEYAELQQVLLFRPESGKVIPRSGGLRKFVGESINKENAVACALFIIG